MKNLVALVFLCAFLTQIVSGQNVTVRGKINSNDPVMILFGNGIKVDTLFSYTGDFHFKRNLLYPELLTLVIIKPRTKDFTKRDFFVGSGEVIVNSDFAGFKLAEIQMSDNYAQDKYNEFRKRFDPLVKIARDIIDSSYDKDKTREEKEIYLDVYNTVLKIENEVAEAFVLENTENIVGAFVFSNFLQTDSYSKLDSIYKLFSPELYASDYLIRIKQKLDALSRIQIGEPFPPFSITTNQGKNLELTNLKGKYLVLDFWGTWCAPCIKGIPKMKEYYSKYQDRVEFIGIACNDSSEKWRAAIEKYGLSWPQVFNGSGNDDLKVRYNVETFPTKMIIDPTGVLIQSFKGETEDFYKELDSLFRSSN